MVVRAQGPADLVLVHVRPRETPTLNAYPISLTHSLNCMLLYRCSFIIITRTRFHSLNCTLLYRCSFTIMPVSCYFFRSIFYQKFKYILFVGNTTHMDVLLTKILTDSRWHITQGGHFPFLSNESNLNQQVYYTSPCNSFRN
jgi:hypothetical protein